MRRRRDWSFRGAPVAFSLGFLAGAAWRGRRPEIERALKPRSSRRAAEPAEAKVAPAAPVEPQPGAERASVLGYERAPAPLASPPPREPQVPSGAPGHRILSG